MNYTSH